MLANSRAPLRVCSWRHSFNVLIKCIAPGKPRLASVTPIVHKLRNQAVNEVFRDGMLSGQPNPVFFRLPIIRDRLGRIRAGTLTLTDGKGI